MQRYSELEEIKRRISKETGVPVELLDGENEEENRSRALAIVAFKKERQEKLEEELTPPQRETTEDQFSKWVESAYPSNEGFRKLFS